MCANPRPQWDERDIGGQSDGEQQNWSDEYYQAWNMRRSLHSITLNIVYKGHHKMETRPVPKIFSNYDYSCPLSVP